MSRPTKPIRTDSTYLLRGAKVPKKQAKGLVTLLIKIGHYATCLPGGSVVGKKATRRAATVHRDRVLGWWIGKIVLVMA